MCHVCVHRYGVDVYGVCVHVCVHVCVEVSVNLRSHPPCVFEVGGSLSSCSLSRQGWLSNGSRGSPCPQHKDNYDGTIPVCTASTLTTESFCPDPHFPASCHDCKENAFL